MFFKKTNDATFLTKTEYNTIITEFTKSFAKIVKESNLKETVNKIEKRRRTINHKSVVSCRKYSS